MVHPAHEAEWPDKVVFANMTIIMAGVLSLIIPIVRWLDGTVDGGSLVLFEEIPAAWTFALGLVAIVLGSVGIRYQAWVWVVLGAVAAILGLGFFGIPALLAFVAIGMVIKGALEGEEMKHDENVVAAHEWPDKAIAASMLFFTLGLITLVHGAMFWTGKAEPFFFTEQSAILGFINLAIAVVCFLAARSCFSLEARFTPWAAGVLGFLSFSFVILGPAIAVAALIMLVLAEKEDEFLHPSVAETA